MKKFIIIFALTIFVMANSAMAQTYGSGGLTNSCATPAAQAGTNSTFIGCDAGPSSGTGGGANTFIGTQAGNSNNGAEENVAVGYRTLYTQSYGSAQSPYSSYNTAVGNAALYTTNSTDGSNGIKNAALGSGAGFNNTTGSSGTFLGYGAGYANTTASNNTFCGYQSGYNTTASENTFLGAQSGYNNSSGRSGTFLGYGAGQANTTASYSTFCGYQSGYNNTAAENTFYGTNSGYSNTTGTPNTFEGFEAGYYNATGAYNTITGYRAGKGTSTANVFDYNSFYGYYSGNGITTGDNNTFYGAYSGANNTTGAHNTCLGIYAGRLNTTGGNNTFVGSNAGYSITDSANTAVGRSAGYNTTSGHSNTFLGKGAGYTNTTGDNNTFLGYAADANSGTLSNATAIGNGAIVQNSDEVRVGNANVTAIGGAVAWNSDGRFKFNITEDVKGLEFIMKLRPVTYQFNTHQFEEFVVKDMPDSIKTEHMNAVGNCGPATNRIRSGFIAQEVKQALDESNFNCSIVNTPDDTAKKTYSLGYAEIVVPLVKAVQEQQQMIDSLAQIISQCCSTKQERKSNGNTGDGNNSIEENQNLQKGSAINIELQSIDKVILYQNIPNPFGEETIINYYLPETVQNAKIVFYDNMGRVIKEVVLEQKGNASVIANSAKLASGIYSYSIVADGKVVDTMKMQRVK